MATVDRLPRLRASQAVRYLASRAAEPALAPRAEYAARGLCLFAEEGESAVEAVRIAPGSQPTVQAFVERLNVQRRDGASETDRAVGRFEAVLVHARPAWSLRALARQGYLHERLARAATSAELALPQDLERGIRGASPDARTQMLRAFEEQVRQLLDPEVRSRECRGVGRYLQALRLAQQEGLVTAPDALFALSRLETYGMARIRECAALEHTRDPRVAPHRPEELIELYRGNCERGLPGCVLLADLYFLDPSVERDPSRGLAALERACERARGRTLATTPAGDEPLFWGSHAACSRKAHELASGDHTTPDVPRAIDIWNRSCAAGYEEACRERDSFIREQGRRRAQQQRAQARAARQLSPGP